MNFNFNFNINNILVFTITILVLYYFYISFNQENFDIDDGILNMKGKTIMNILPLFNRNGYLATFIDNGEESNNLIYTNELKSNNWHGPFENGGLPNSVIVDLTYDIDKRLMAVGMELINDEPVYTIYKKSSDKLNSLWQPIKSNSKTIRSIIYDLNGTMIGISSFDGQIYKNMGGRWIGPINYDKPMKKVMFDSDNIMIGIGLIDNNIYKKNSIDWKSSKWNTENKNRRRVYDIVHDYDGKLLATTKDGIEKQKNNVYISQFESLNNIKDSNPILTKNEMLLYKCGINFEQYSLLEANSKSEEENEKIKNLNNLLRFKKKAMEVCKNKNKLYSTINLKQSVKQEENEQIINKINEQIDILRNKGF